MKTQIAEVMRLRDMAYESDSERSEWWDERNPAVVRTDLLETAEKLLRGGQVIEGDTIPCTKVSQRRSRP